MPTSELTSSDEQRSASWPATSPYVLAVGGTNLTLTSSNTIASSGVWSDTTYPKPYNLLAGGGGDASMLEDRPWWQPALPSQSTYRMVPDVAAFADASPGYAIICSFGVDGCGPAPGQTIEFVGGTSAATPLVAGMIALWDQKASQSGWPRPGFVPPLLYSIARNDPTRSSTSRRARTSSSKASRAAPPPRATTWRRASAHRSPIRSSSTSTTE